MTAQPAPSKAWVKLETYHNEPVDNQPDKRVKTPSHDIHMVWVGVARQSPSYGYKLPYSSLPDSNFPTDKLPTSNLPNGNIGSLLKSIRMASANSLYRARSPTVCLCICVGDVVGSCICVGDVGTFENGSHYLPLLSCC